MYSQLSSDGQAPERASAARSLKVGAALGVSGLLLLAVYAFNSFPYASGAVNGADLIGIPMSSSLRSNAKGPSAMLPKGLASIPGPSPWKELALAGLETMNTCDRDVSTNAHNNLKAVMATMDSKSKAVVARATAAAASKVQEMPGIIAPTGFFDPMGLSTDLPEGRLVFLREVELKHGRLCMLAAAGFIMGEKFHPFFGDIDEAGIKQITETSLSGFWVGLALFVSIPEALSIKNFEKSEKYGYNIMRAFTDDFTMKTDRVPGDLGFDPLGMKPGNPKDLLEMQNKELSNGRLAMLAVAGIIAQEMVTGEKIFS